MKRSLKMNKRGAEDSFRNLVLGSVLVLLFVFCIFSFFIATGNEYGADTSQLTNGYYDFSAINQTLSETQAQAEEFRTATSQTTESNSIFGQGIGFFNGVGAFFSVIFKMFGFIVNLFDLILVGTFNIIFGSAVITSTIIAIVILLALFAIFRFLKIGS